MSWRDAILLSAAISGFILPLLWALRELYFPRDDAPLRIDNQYSRDDRFFAHAFERLLEEQLGARPRVAGSRALPLYGERHPVVTTRGNCQLSGMPVVEPVLDVQGNLRVAPRTVVRRGVFATGRADIGDSSRLAALLSKRSVTLGRNVAIDSWVDCEDSLQSGDGCRLGARATAGESIHLGRGVKFNLLSAPEIVVGQPAPAAELGHPDGEPLAQVAPSDVPLMHLANQTTVARGSLICPDHVHVRGNVVVRGSAVLGEGMVLDGSLYADGAVLMLRGACVTGSLLAGGAVRIDPESRIGEHLISGDALWIGENVTVGAPERVTTVLGYETIELEQGVRVFGRILARRGGRTRSIDAPHLGGARTLP